jgi:NAD(P)H-dependent flavin oxidoreductase YrpB (nitropropane dioxygenase family)
MMGASAVWVGTRFVLSEEAGAPEAHKEAVRTAGFDDTIRTLIFTGRPLRVRKNPYIMNWETERQQEIRELTSQGKLPYEADLDKVMNGEAEETPVLKGAKMMNVSNEDEPEDVDDLLDQFRPYLMGKCAAVCNDKKPAKAIVDEFVRDAVASIKQGSKYVTLGAKL